MTRLYWAAAAGAALLPACSDPTGAGAQAFGDAGSEGGSAGVGGGAAGAAGGAAGVAGSGGYAGSIAGAAGSGGVGGSAGSAGDVGNAGKSGAAGAAGAAGSGANTKPGPHNTGVPPGHNLANPTTDSAKGITVASNGNVTITKPGVFTNLLITGRLIIQADDVTLRFCRIEAKPEPWDLPDEPSTTAACLAAGDQSAQAITCFNRKNILIEDSEVEPQRKSTYLANGIHGSGYTLRRVDISGTVDGAGVFNADETNVVIEDSYIHDLYVGQWSPGHGCDEPSHSDGVQVHYGKNTVIRNNTIAASSVTAYLSTSAVLVSQASNYFTSLVTIEGNWLDYGSCSVNIHDKAKTPTIEDLSIVDNRFGKNQSTNPKCAMIVVEAVQKESTTEISGNTWEDGSKPDPVVTNGG